MIEDWTKALAPVHHFDLASPRKTYRVLLLPNGLEVDLGFTSARDFAANSPRFRLVFGEHAVDETRTEPDVRYETGLGWHHVLHARACIARGKPWQAVWLINGVRDHTITLARACGSGSTRGSHAARTSCPSTRATRSCARRSPTS